MVNTDDTTKNNIPRTNKRPLVANTPALRNAQRELKAKAELMVRLTEMEYLLTKNVQREKQFLQTITAGLAMINAQMGGNFRKRSLQHAFYTFHKEGQRMMMAGSCEKVWKDDSELLESLERFEAKKEKSQKEWEKARNELRILRVRRNYAIKCVVVLRSYLGKVRDKQQGTI